MIGRGLLNEILLIAVRRASSLLHSVRAAAARYSSNLLLFGASLKD